MVKKTSGNAESSMNGYHYQRLYTILLILESFDNPQITKVNEEYIEDCDFFSSTNELVLNQIKYHNSNTIESIAYNSGLYKVITRVEILEKYNNISQINYISYSKNKDVYNNLNKFFEKTKESNELLRKYLQMIEYNNYLDCSKNKIPIRIDNEHEQIHNLYNQNKEKINNYLIDNSNNYFYSLLLDNNISNNYFLKINLIKGEEYNVLIDKIDCLIKKNYYNNQHTNKTNLIIIRMLIYNYLMENMFGVNKAIKIDKIRNIDLIQKFILNKNDPIIFEKFSDTVNKIIQQENTNYTILEILADDNIQIYNEYKSSECLKNIINITNKYIEIKDGKQDFLDKLKCFLFINLSKSINNYIDDSSNKIICGKISHIMNISFIKGEAKIKKNNRRKINNQIVEIINNYNNIDNKNKDIDTSDNKIKTTRKPRKSTKKQSYNEV